jgi:hypothetical protein
VTFDSLAVGGAGALRHTAFWYSLQGSLVSAIVCTKIFETFRTANSKDNFCFDCRTLNGQVHNTDRVRALLKISQTERLQGIYGRQKWKKDGERVIIINLNACRESMVDRSGKMVRES